MTNDSTHLKAKNQFDDEIDLLELFAIIWKGKFIIIGTTLVFALLGLWKAYTDQEWWVSTAKVSAPNYQQFQRLANHIQPLWPDDPGLVLNDIGFNSASVVHEYFIRAYQSTDNKRTFLTEHVQSQPHLPTNNMEQLLDTWAGDIRAHMPRDASIYTLEFSATTPQESQSALRGYIDYINGLVADNFTVALHEWRTTTTTLHQQRLNLAIQRTMSKSDIDQARLQHALEIARAADVKSPMLDPGVQDDFAINLGTRAIEAKLRELQQIEDPAVLNPSIRQAQLNLSRLKGVELAPLENFKAYYFQDSPALPLSRKAPKRPLILAAAIFIGGTLGVLAVFLLHGIRSYRGRLSAQ